MKCNYYLLVVGLSFVSFCFSKQYVPVDAYHLKYSTTRQKKRLFELVGSQYSNVMEINVAHFEKIKPTKTDYYKNHRAEILELSEKYRDDVLHHTLAPMYLKWISSVIGYGVFAGKDIRKDDFIGVYAGQLRFIKEAEDSKSEDVDYAWYYTIAASKDRRLIVDGKYRGNELRFINHDSNPNTKRIDVLVNGMFYVCYVASQDIPKDTQLTVNYGDGYWTTRNVDPEIFNKKQ